MKGRTQLLAAGLLFAAAAAVPALAQDYPNYWVQIGSQRFQGKFDREADFAGWAGRSVDRIGLRAIDGPAQCTRVRVRFRNGNARDLPVGSLRVMYPGRVYRLDLPGRERNVAKVALRCHGLGQRAVSIQILARK